MIDFEQLEEALEQAVDLFGSAAEKVMKHNPSWVEFFSLLSEDEQRVFFAFVYGRELS